MKRIEECANIPDSDRQLMADLKQIVRRFVPDVELMLYGSAARGEREPDSDYDVVILVNTPLSREQEEALDSAIYSLELDRGVVLSTLIYTRGQWDEPLMSVTPYRRNVEREGLVL